MSKTKEQVLKELEVIKLEHKYHHNEQVCLRVLDALANAEDYVRRSRDERAEIEEQDAYWSSPEGIEERKRLTLKPLKEQENEL